TARSGSNPTRASTEISKRCSAPAASAAESRARPRPAAGWARCGVAPVRGGVGLCPVRGGVGPCPVLVGICPVYGPEALNRATTTRMARVNILDFRGETLNKRFLAQRLPRAAETHADIERRVADLLETVAAGGSAAVQDFTERFDGVRPDSLRVPDSALAAAEAELDPRVKAALVESIDRARRVAADQRPADVRTELASGAFVTTRHLPVERVGLYVPGGLAVYPSTVIMNVVPAQTA